MSRKDNARNSTQVRCTGQHPYVNLTRSMNTSFQRNRRLRLTPSLRKMVSENSIRPEQLIKPIFIHLGKDNIPLPKLPDSEVLSLFNGLLKYIEKLMRLGILGVNLYPVLAH